jgi:hypothetical protein
VDGAANDDFLLEECVSRLQKAKYEAMISSGRIYDPSIGDWLDNAIIQQAADPFHAIIASANRGERRDILVVEEIDDSHPLLVSPVNWEVERCGSNLGGRHGAVAAYRKRSLVRRQVF